MCRLTLCIDFFMSCPKTVILAAKEVNILGVRLVDCQAFYYKLESVYLAKCNLKSIGLF